MKIISLASTLVALATPIMADTTVSFAYWGDPAELPPFERLVAEYEAANPGVTIDVQHAPWSGYWTRLDAQLAAGAGPDVFFVTNVPSYAARGALAPLDAHINASNFPINEYNQEALRPHSYDGQLYSLPRDNATLVLYYNKDAFDAANLSHPNDSWSWDELSDAAKALAVSSGGRTSRYGIVTESNNWDVWVSQNGGSIFDDGINPTTFKLDEPAAIEAIQYIGDMMNVDRSMPSYLEASQSGGTTQMFLSGQAAMSITNAARLGSYAKADFDWAIAPLPKGPQGLRSNVVGGAGFGLNSNAKDMDAAWDFLSYISGAEGQAIFASAAAPAVPAMNGNPMVQSSFSAPFAEVFLSETDNGKLTAQFPKWVDLQNLYIQPALDLVWNGEVDAATAIGSIADQVEAALAQQ